MGVKVMKQILVIEDDEQLSRLLELELAHKGYSPEIVSDGNAGLSKLQSKDLHSVQHC
jgi:DNA-binding response OmpR family regulator